MSRQINQAGIELLKRAEGLRLTAYKDPVGIWTIGYGSTRNVKPGMRISAEEAEQLLKMDLWRFEKAVQVLTKVPLTDNQFSALVSFAYNIGENALAKSTLLRKLNAGDYQGAAKEFRRWVKAGGITLPGLVRRREAEMQLFLKPDDANDPTASS